MKRQKIDKRETGAAYCLPSGHPCFVFAKFLIESRSLVRSPRKLLVQRVGPDWAIF